MPSPEKLYEKANQAAADAMRLARQPNGAGLAAVRRRDARVLREMAREALRL